MGCTWHTKVLAIGIAASITAIVLSAGFRAGLAGAEGHRAAVTPYPWLKSRSHHSLESRIQPPPGFQRIRVLKGTFGAWLRGLPVRAGRQIVWLCNGKPKGNQDAHHAVLEIDVGKRDLQQCADAIIRLRAEFLRSRGCEDSIAFHFTSGDSASWPRWRAGERPRVRGNRVTWARTARPDASYANFRKYLIVVFTYAGTLSLAKELKPVKDRSAVKMGDVFIRGGSPGHAVLVVDVATNPAGERVFLLAQSYMPAQDIHVLKNPQSQGSPWYPAKQSGVLITPEWNFRYQDLRRFPPLGCDGVGDALAR